MAQCKKCQVIRSITIIGVLALILLLTHLDKIAT